MDMRGRCSAGQRVLASLVIRLALAEVRMNLNFCRDFVCVDVVDLYAIVFVFFNADVRCFMW